MNKINFKIAIRTFLKGKWFNFLNIGGLTLSLSAFIIVMLYVDNETSYDKWNKNFDHIYLVERELPDGPSPYTPGKLAAAIKNQCPEVEEAGRINTALFEIPFFTESGKFLVKKWLGADYSIANILGIEPQGFKLDPNSITPTVLLSTKTASVLFPKGASVENKIVTMMSKSGEPMTIAGVAKDPPGNTNLTYDCIAFAQDITQGKDQSYANQIYQTYILVRPGTDIDLLSKKIDKIYKASAMDDTSQVAKQTLANSKSAAIYLDPLKNLHLKPHFGSRVNYQIVNGLIALAVIILIITCVNFTSLYISQAYKRAKEVGVKKVNGVIPVQIAFQFLVEIFIQCVIALIFALGIVAIGLPYFNQLLQVNISMFAINGTIVIQLVFTLIGLTLLAGVYPALVMAGFKPADVFRGNILSSGQKFSWIQSSITVLQFTFTIIFIITLIIINQQVKYMQTDDRGFTAKQVIYIDNLVIYNKPKSFQSIRDGIKAVPGVKYVTVATHVPGGIMPNAREYSIEGKTASMNTLGVDYEYFETLNIQLKEGRTFSQSFLNDTANAVINESAARTLDIQKPLGKTIKGCQVNYKIIGIIKDVKDYGYEEDIKPVIYLMNDACGMVKTQIIFSSQNNRIPAILTTLNKQWSEINKLDGENFNYHYIDALYGKLFAKQEQLQTVLFYFSALAIFIASLGLFSSAVYAMNIRMKEIVIRKVLGATKTDLVILLNKPFIYMILIANLIGWPLSLLIANKWLEIFAYRIDLSVNPFILAFIISLFIVAVTVCLQTIRTVKVNPAVKLKIN